MYLAFYTLPCVIITFLFSFNTWAGPFTINATGFPTSGNAAVDLEIKSEIKAALAKISTDVNSDLPDTSGGGKYTDAMANSAVVAGKGIGVDYGSDMELFMVGARVGVGVDVGENSFSDLIAGDVDAEQISGFGAGVALVGGLNLGMFDWSEEDPEALFKWSNMNLFFNVFKYDLDNKDVKAGITTLGVHLQYKLIEAKTYIPLVFTWTGIQVTTGYEYNNLTIGISKAVSETFTETVDFSAPLGTKDLSATATGTASIDANVTTHSIPIEISTGAQFLYLFTLYGGLGTDINFGSSDVTASFLGDVDATIPTTTGQLDATAALDLGVAGGPNAFLFRGFTGLQLNAWIAKINIQIDKTFGQNLYGVKAGLSLVW